MGAGGITILKMSKLNLYNILQECKVERDVEQKYKQILLEYFPKAEIGSPYRTDGLLLNDNLKILMEFKHNIDLTKRLDLVDLLIQMLYYLKEFEQHGEELPTILFGGDINECFCLHSNSLIPYLNENVDWSIGASTAPSKNPELAKKLYDDQSIIPFIFHVNNNHFDFKFVVDKIIQLHEGTVQKVHITELNINRFFSYFRDKIIKQSSKYSAEDLVAIFLNCLIDSQNNYPHPNKKNILVTNVVGDVLINRSLYDAFMEHFESLYSIEEKKRLTAICDRLIADEQRRFHGEFYTPTEWVLEAHKMIEDTFGPNWKEEYVVWDPAWGTGNLTRDFKFKELYCSTLNYGDLQVGQHYNPEAVKFQYDFLNDDIEFNGVLLVDVIKKIPSSLVNAFRENKKVLILANFPFGKSSGNFSGKTKAKRGLAKSDINQAMSKEKYSNACSQLYAQFLYRILKMKEHYRHTNLDLAFFSPTIFLTGGSYKTFRYDFLRNFNYLNGMIINSGYFSNVSSGWPIAFSLFNSSVNQNEFQYQIKDFDEEYNIKTIRTKTLYNTDNSMRGSDWVKELDIKNPKIDCPQVGYSLSLKESGGGVWCENAIGYLINNSNSVYTNYNMVSLFTSGFWANSIGFPFTERSFDRIVSFFTARKPISSNLENQKDEYLAPNEQHPEYPQWNIDAIIYSLFNGSSNQSSLRQITYKDKLWDIKNEWFWMSNEQMKQLANEHGFDELYHDANGDHDRFVFNKIQESSFSQDAADVYNKACELVIKTFPYRQQLHEEYPEWHLHAWDAGWYQIKLILKKYFKDDLKEFNELYKKFEDRMREGVYKFGFLN